MIQLPITKYCNEDMSFSLSTRKIQGFNSMPSSHFHKTYELYYLWSGERYYFIKDRTYHITKGDMVLINAQDLHKTTDAGMPDHERLLINFTGDFIISMKDSFDRKLFYVFENNHHLIRFSEEDRLYIESLFLNMLNEIQQKRTGFEAYVRALLMQLLIFCTRYVEQQPDNPVTHPSPLHEKVSDIVRHINTNYSEDLTLHDLASNYYISPFYLSRIFKTATGFTFTEYLNSVRVKEAQKLLLESRMKVIAISEKTGFGSIAHFGRVFKDLTGFSPLQYRKAYRP